ncbi:Major facilitator superfamily [Carpediemonas membranifera]|uniref:Major facilitator superfamily n=1 Tax=Carpediemonas membranifera TaxID=201153 RepID=A0A8J6AZB9_9EUKA|nr:Major facilitator superfamily [Carpediemonas membranifera]|eukprot:KAG9396005.1 Major facilitator superfamily [Carpediemonas membranifera]
MDVEGESCPKSPGWSNLAISNMGQEAKFSILPLAIVLIFGTAGSIFLKAVFPFVIMRMDTRGVAFGSVSSGFMLGKVIGSPIIGVVADRFDKRYIIAICQLGCVIGLFLTANAKTIGQLVAARTVGGFFAATVTIVYALAASKTESSQRSKVMVRLTAALTTTIMVGGYLGHVLVKYIGFEHTVFVGAASSGVAILAALFLVQPSPPSKADAQTAGEDEESKGRGRSIFRRQVVVILVQNALFMVLQGSVGQLLPLLARSGSLNVDDPQELSATGILAGGVGKMALQFSPLIGLAYSKFSEPRVIAMSFLCFAVVFTVLPSARTGPAFLTLTVAEALCSAFIQPATNSLLSRCVDKGSQAAIAGVNSSLQALAGVVTPLALGQMFDVFGMRTSGIAAAVAAVACALFVWLFVPCRPCQEARNEKKNKAL